MLIYLDTVIVIYAIEGSAPFQSRALARLAAANAVNDQVATSDLTRFECAVHPIRTKNALLQADYSQWLARTRVLPLAVSAFDRAAQIRADYNYGVVDSLHLATAIVGNCNLFLTNDVRLAGFPGIPVEILQ